MRSETSVLVVKKILIGVTLIIVVLVLFFTIGDKKDNTTKENIVYQNTISISRAYVALRLKTDKVLTQASTYPDHSTWDAEVTELVNNWKNLEEKASVLEEQADFEGIEKVGLGLINVAKAYTRDEISNVFDKAKAGKKIRTLAKYLGVDARKAFEILKSDQEYIKDKWTKTGDNFQFLEKSAIVLKNGCKVTVFVAGVVASGGAAGVAVGGTGAVSSAGTALVTTVVGTDLILEVSADAATVALGDKNKTTKYISKIRSDSYLEPTAAILSLTDVPGLSKAALVVMEAETLRSAVQDKKILGIDISKPSKGKASKVNVSALNKEDLKDWAKDRAVDMKKNKESSEDASKNEKESEMSEGGEDDFDYEDDWEEDVDLIEGWLDSFEEEMEIEDDGEMDDENVIEEMGSEEIGDLEEWLDGFEDLDDWMDEAEEEEVLTEEEEKEESDEAKSDEKDSQKIVDKYMKEMQGKAMEDYQTSIEYAEKFTELVEDGKIDESQRRELLEEVNRIAEKNRQESMGKEEREAELLDNNEEEYMQINRSRPPIEKIFKMTEAERAEVDAAQVSRQNARRARLKESCISIHGEGEAAERCYVIGKF